MGLNLWLTAAHELELFVHVVRFQDAAFHQIITLLEHPSCSLQWGTYRKRHRNLTVVFADVAPVPDVATNQAY